MTVTAWLVKEYLGHLTQAEGYEDDEIIALCKASLREIEAMLKADADRNDVRIASAAASLAFYKMTLKNSFSSSDNVTSFKAGDVSITQDKGGTDKKLERAERLYAKALESIVPLCTDNGFAFENIRIRVQI